MYSDLSELFPSYMETALTSLMECLLKLNKFKYGYYK